MTKKQIKDRIKLVKSRIRELDQDLRDIDKVSLRLERLQNKNFNAYHKTCDKQDNLYHKLELLEAKLDANPSSK